MIRSLVRADGTINTSNVNDLKFVLNTLRANNLKAILPLTYGSQDCSILTDQQKYKKFVSDHEALLRQIEDYSDMVYIVVFTEAVWGCTDVGNSYPTLAGGERMSKYIQETLGRLPADLPQDIRSKFTFGLHDSFISKGWNQGTSAMYAGPNSYDFLSFPNYYGSVTEDEIRVEIDKMINRMRKYHPTTPLFSGETGASYCGSGGEAEQSHVLRSSVSYLLQKGIGLNVWQWKPINFRDADSTQKDCRFGGHAITNPDSSLKESARALRALLSSSPLMQNITSAGINTAFQPWAIWVVASNLESSYTVHLFDTNGTVWAQNVGIVLAGDKSWMSFQLPANIPPSQCNIGSGCAIRVQIVAPTSSNNVYNPFTINLPPFIEIKA